MIRKSVYAALLAGSAFAFSTGASAQEAPAGQQAEPTEPDQSDAAADAVIAGAQPIDELQAKIELLQAQVESLQEALNGVQAAQVKVTPSWKGAPQFEDKEGGWTFKPRGRIQYDVGYVTNPEDALGTRNLGFNTRARRIRLGVEGTIPGGFGYKAEMDFAGAQTGFGDVILTYAPAGKPYSLSIGNHETLNGLEQITSSRYISFLERSSFNDAFGNTRRIGLSAGYANQANTLRIAGGLFAAHSIDNTFDNDGWIGAARATYSPLMGANQLHFGASFQHRNFQSNANGAPTAGNGQPSNGQLARYRARPFSQITDVRFVDTRFSTGDGDFAAKSDNIFGLELAGIFKSLHVSAEGQMLTVNAYEAGDTEAGNDGFAGNTSVLVPGGNPTFWGGYVEAGYFITGETRGYKNGLWDRTKVLNPFSKGGWGAFQVNGRFEYLDLDDDDLKEGFRNNFSNGTFVASNNYARGGKQLGLLASLLWIPEDYMRFYLQYARAEITGGPNAALVDPNTPAAELDEVEYGVDVVQARAQIDF